ncbi:MAG: adenosylcobinamide-GDP ribazoletransferase [Chloroflexi bacterium]|nr:MAG: adenosylcobinamide-GDP ribazoletransferase [Chloroflexota bacterium]
MLQPVIYFFVALQFLTVSPALIRRIFTPQEMGQATACFPLVGALIGGLILATSLLLDLIFPPFVRAGLVLALWVGISGGLHLDGFLDSCDGLFGGFTPEERLEIMKDERVGAFAFAGGFLLLLLKFSALSSLPAGTVGLLIAPIISRWVISTAIFAFPYAREKGLGRAMKDHMTAWQVVISAVLMLAFVVWLAGWLGLAAAGAAVLLMGISAAFILRRIPGLTGDSYGALNEIVELGVLLLFAVRGMS